MRRAHSDPGPAGFRSSFRLSGPHAVKRGASLSSTLPRIERQCPPIIDDLLSRDACGVKEGPENPNSERSAPERRLLRGISTRTGRWNARPGLGRDFELPALPRDRRGLSLSAVHLRGPGSFEEDVGSIVQSIASIRCSQDNFTGQSQDSGTSPQSCASASGPCVHGATQRQALSQKERLEQYKYSRRMDAEDPPLASLLASCDEIRPRDLDRQHAEIVLRNMSEEQLRSWNPDLRRAQLAELSKTRALHHDAARERRILGEDIKYQQGVAKISEFDARMQRFAAAGDLRRLGPKAVHPKEMQERQCRFLVALAAASFMQTSVDLIMRYTSIVRGYRQKLAEETTAVRLPAAQGNVAMKVAKAIGEDMLVRHFTSVALAQLQKEWRGQPENLAHWLAFPMPTKEEASRLLKSCSFIHSSLIRKVKWRRNLRSATVLRAAILRMRPLRPYASMLGFARRVRLIQRWVRSSFHRLAAARAEVEAVWERLEFKIVSEELRAEHGEHQAVAARAVATRGGRRRGHPPQQFAHAVCARCTSPDCRTAVLEKFLRERRCRLLPVLDAWHMSFADYETEVAEWRAARLAAQCAANAHKRRSTNVVLAVLDEWQTNVQPNQSSTERRLYLAAQSRMPGGAPALPPVPSHLPSEDEVLELIMSTRNGFETGREHGRSVEQHPRANKDLAATDGESFEVDSVGCVAVPGRVHGLELIRADLRL